MATASGIRVELKVEGPGTCPVASASGGSDVSGYSLSKSAAPNSDGSVTEEFVLDIDGDAPEEMDELFSYGDESVYRFDREPDVGCPCERIEQFNCPVVDVQTRDGALFLTFHAPDIDILQDVVAQLRDECDGVDVQRLLQSSANPEQDLVIIERGQLTARQREALETAHEMGYFDHPRQANKGEVAEALGITTSTFSEHLSMAQKKLMSAILQA